MQQGLEEVLKNKERELRLYKRFLALRALCEDGLFQTSSLPLKAHILQLKNMVEMLIPDPRDRTEEMFSGELFTLLGMIYLHDIGLTDAYSRFQDKWKFSEVDSPERRMLLNHSIGERLGIPARAIELINYLIFSDSYRGFPMEWEIVEDDKKAIVRNTRVLFYIFYFCHLLLDVFYSDLRNGGLRRTKINTPVLSCGGKEIHINPKEGLIRISYVARIPYQLHMLKKVKDYIEEAFVRFKDVTGGKLGFSYKSLEWDISSDFKNEKGVFEVKGSYSSDGLDGLSFEASRGVSEVMDKLFEYRNTLLVGEMGTGKSMLIKASLMPQLALLSPNLFYCELWSRPVEEIKDIMFKKLGMHKDPLIDIASLCIKLLEKGPCFFILDSFERYTSLDRVEREKLDRFIEFCSGREDVYMLLSGDKETFFKWCCVLSGRPLDAVCEMKVDKAEEKRDSFWIENSYLKKNDGDEGANRLSLDGRHISIEKVLEDLLKRFSKDHDFRSIVSAFIDRTQDYLIGRSIEELFFDTGIPKSRIFPYLNFLIEKEIIKTVESGGILYYVLSGRYLLEPIYRILRLDEFEEKRKIRNMLKNAVINRSFLDSEGLELVDRYRGQIYFNKEEMGLILSSLIRLKKDYKGLLEETKEHSFGVDIKPILALFYSDDRNIRQKAVELLIEINDKDMVNPMLYQLEKESVPEIVELLIKGIICTGKRGAILALMNTLKGMGKRQLKFRALDLLCDALGEKARDILVEVKEEEKDPLVLSKLDNLLNIIEGNALSHAYKG